MVFSRLIHLMDCKSIEETGYDRGMEQGISKGKSEEKKLVIILQKT